MAEEAGVELLEQPQPPEDPLLKRIRPVVDVAKHKKVLVYGKPGVGKTVFAASAPYPLLIDAENGSLSLLNHEHTANVPVLKVESFEDVETLFWRLKAGELPSIQTVIIDTISELQRRKMDEQLRYAAKRDRNRNPYLPFQGDYKENTEILRRMLVSFRDLDRNLVVTAHTIEDKDGEDGHIYWRPAVTPKLADTLTAIFDVIGYLSIDDKGTRTLQVRPTQRVIAKTRVGHLAGTLINPTFADLLQADVLEDLNAQNAS